MGENVIVVTLSRDQAATLIRAAVAHQKTMLGACTSEESDDLEAATNRLRRALAEPVETKTRAWGVVHWAPDAKIKATACGHTKSYDRRSRQPKNVTCLECRDIIMSDKKNMKYGRGQG
jgi:hypothetical protein